MKITDVGVCKDANYMYFGGDPCVAHRAGRISFRGV